MAWNEGDKDPWGGKKKDQGPPDLDKIVGNFFKKLFGGKPSSDSGSGPKGSAKGFGIGIILVIVILVVIWIIAGFYVVGPAEEAVVLRFGNYVETQGSGLHWVPRFISTRTIVNVRQVYNFSYQSEMLTEDENIVSVELAVQYRVTNPFDFLYNVVNPVESLQQATASATRQVIGHTDLDPILTTERQKVTEEITKQLRKTLSGYKTGIDVVQVTLQSTKPPEQVTDAFNDAIKAREDEQRYQNQAQAYASNVVPIAQGKAKRMLAEAKAYKQQTVLDAKGQVATYLSLLPEYNRAPNVIRDRLYLSTMQDVLMHTTKVFLTDSNKNLLYLPLNKIMTQPVPEAKKDVNVDETSTDKTMESDNQAAPSSKTNAPLIYQGGYFGNAGERP